MCGGNALCCTRWPLLTYCYFRLRFIMLLFAFMSSASIASARSLGTCTCIHFNVSGTFQTPNYPLSKPTQNTCILYSFIAPADHIIEALFDAFEFRPRTER
ncbi:Suppressor of lurcher protein 1, partial [Toxocara canis]